MHTKQAMLDGIERNRIIVGAYVDREGGVCPMLAAHRNGGRTSLASFARAWDRYTHAKGGQSRPASERELRTLRTMLEASIALDEDVGRGELGEAIAEHKATVERRLRERLPERRPRERPRDTGEHDRTGELRAKPGWAWLRPFRRIEDYELAMRELERMERERRRRRERELV
jgi:hypothetical protein